MIFSIFLRDVSLALKRGGGAWGALMFSLMAFTAFAFSLAPDALAQHAHSLMAVMILFATLQGLPNLFEEDAEDGVLEQYLLLPAPFALILTAKFLAFWLTAVLPTALLAPLFLLAAGAETALLNPSLLLASLAFAAIGMLGAALTVGLRKAGLLQALLLLPLYLPALIFATGGATALLAGFTLCALPISLLLSSALLKHTAN